MKRRLCRRCLSVPPSSGKTINQILYEARNARPELRAPVLEIVAEHILCFLFGVCHPCGRDAARAAMPPNMSKELAKGGEA